MPTRAAFDVNLLLIDPEVGGTLVPKRGDPVLNMGVLCTVNRLNTGFSIELEVHGCPDEDGAGFFPQTPDFEKAIDDAARRTGEDRFSSQNPFSLKEGMGQLLRIVCERISG